MEKDYLNEFFRICRENGFECHKKSLRLKGSDCVKFTIQKEDLFLGLILTLDGYGSQEGYIFHMKSKYLNIWREELYNKISFNYNDGILWIGSESWDNNDFIEVSIVDENNE